MKTDGCFNIESGQVREVFVNPIDNESNTERSSRNEYLQKRLTSNKPFIKIKGAVDSDTYDDDYEKEPSPRIKPKTDSAHERKYSQEVLQTTEFKPVFQTPLNNQAPN